MRIVWEDGATSEPPVTLTNEKSVPVHVDGAGIFNAAVALLGAAARCTGLKSWRRPV